MSKGIFRLIFNTQVNVQRSLIREYKLYEFELSYKTTKASQNLKSYHHAVTRWFKIVFKGCKDLYPQVRSVKLKAECYVAVFKELTANPLKGTWEKYEPTYPPIYGLNSTTTVLMEIDFGIK